MTQFETTTDALIECVKPAGGPKVVGHRIWPEKTVDAAQRHLLNCLNEGKAERLTPDQVLLIARLARERGCHAYAEHIADSLSYAPPHPVEPKDAADELRRSVIEMATKAIEATAAMTAAMSNLEQLERPGLRVAS